MMICFHTRVFRVAYTSQCASPDTWPCWNVIRHLVHCLKYSHAWEKCERFECFVNTLPGGRWILISDTQMHNLDQLSWDRFAVYWYWMHKSRKFNDRSINWDRVYLYGVCLMLENGLFANHGTHWISHTSGGRKPIEEKKSKFKRKCACIFVNANVRLIDLTVEFTWRYKHGPRFFLIRSASYL